VIRSSTTDITDNVIEYCDSVLHTTLGDLRRVNRLESAEFTGIVA